MIALFIFSILIDILWAIVIAWRTWFSDAYDKLAPWEKGLHITTTIMVGINLVLKVDLQDHLYRFESAFRKQNQAVVPTKVPKHHAIHSKNKGLKAFEHLMFLEVG